MDTEHFDLAILGGGLAGGLIALAMAARRPDLRLAVIESGARFGGHHVWSFFASDIAAADAHLVEPLLAARWDGYDVRFPGLERTLSTPYRSATSDRLDAALRAALPASSLFNEAAVQTATPTGATLADGRTIKAEAVIDARGATGLPHLEGGWQKFLGAKLKLARPHGLVRPMVMDARIDQIDGYRFVYCLPFAEDEIFVEDTYYSSDPALDAPALRQRIADYATAQGWQVAESGYEETGVLPVIAGGDFEAFWQTGDPALARAGARAALIHPLTSYSLPDAVRFASHLSALDNLSAESLGRASHAWAAQHWRQGRFYRMLTRMLFGAARAEERWRVLERFYRLPEPLIERFYAGRSPSADMLRVLAGKPPVPLGAAVRCLMGGREGIAPLEITR